MNATRTSIVFPQPVTFDRVVVMEDLHYGQHVHRYEIQALVGGHWKTLAAARTIGHKKIDRFAPAPATAVRIRVIESSDTPRIRDFAVYNASGRK
jgi:alpha-L-fucosidase